MLDSVGREFGLQDRLEVVDVRDGIVCAFTGVFPARARFVVCIGFCFDRFGLHFFLMTRSAVFHRFLRGSADRLSLGWRLAALRFRHDGSAYCGGKYFRGSTGFSRRRTSKKNTPPARNAAPL